MPTIGDNIKAIRESLGLTQDQAADKCGLKQNQFSKWEKNHANPTMSSLLRLRAGMGVSLDRFVMGVDPEFDLSCQTGDLESGRTPSGVAHDPAAARLEQYLDDFSKEAREVLHLSDQLHAAATRLEEIRKAAKGATGRRSRDRKTG